MYIYIYITYNLPTFNQIIQVPRGNHPINISVKGWHWCFTGGNRTGFHRHFCVTLKSSWGKSKHRIPGRPVGKETKNSGPRLMKICKNTTKSINQQCSLKIPTGIRHIQGEALRSQRIYCYDRSTCTQQSIDLKTAQTWHQDTSNGCTPCLITSSSRWAQVLSDSF